MYQKIAYIDLKARTVSQELISQELRNTFLGGRGLNIYLLTKLCPPGVDPLDPSNPLIIGAGLLTGLNCPSPSRTSVTAKSPETGLLADSNFGGHFGPGLRKTGIDHLVFQSQAESAVYVLVNPDGVQILDAANLWGLDTYQTQVVLKKRHGPKAHVMCIGPAGENLVRFACIRHDLKSAAGRGGLGCVMGNKKLKAVVVMGGTRPTEAFPNELKEYTQTLNQRLYTSRTREVLHDRGTAFLFDLHNFQGILRVRNAQGSRFQGGKKISSKAFKKFYTRKLACHRCMIACRHGYTIDEGGQEVQAVGPEYGTIGAFGPICGINSPEAILKLNDLVNRLGLDSSSTGNIIAWAMHLFEQGVLDQTMTDGLELTWGNPDIVSEVVSRIAYAKPGFGTLMGKGALEASRIIGQVSSKSLIWSKNLLQSDSVDVRAHKGFALGVATSTRGADHLRSRPTMEALSLSKKELKDIYQVDIEPVPTSYQGKARMVWQSELEYALGDAVGICRFAQRFNSLEHLGIHELQQLVQLGSGLRFAKLEFWQIGERILTLERDFLRRERMDKKADSLPEIYYQPLQEGSFKGEKIDPEQFKHMLQEYYELHGWDPHTGMPTRKNLDDLMISNI